MKPPLREAAAVPVARSELYFRTPESNAKPLNTQAIECRTVSPIAPAAGGMFDWADHGRLAHAVEVTDQHGHIIDAVSWFPNAPGRWWLLRGEGNVLGAHRLLVVNPIKLISTPAAWNHSRDPSAVCILQWDRIWPAHIFGPRKVVCDSKKLADRLMRRHREMPSPFEVQHG